MTFYHKCHGLNLALSDWLYLARSKFSPVGLVKFNPYNLAVNKLEILSMKVPNKKLSII